MILQQQGASSRSVLGSALGDSDFNHWGDSVLLFVFPVRFKSSFGSEELVSSLQACQRIDA